MTSPAAGRAGGLVDGRAATVPGGDWLSGSPVPSPTPTLEFAYVDETGNTGDVGRGASRTYTLGCVLVPADQWTLRLEMLTKVRRDIKRMYGVRLRDELKAYYLTRPRGPLEGSGLGDGQLRDIYRRSIRVLNQVSTGVFAVVIDKQELMSGDPFDIAWAHLVHQLKIRSGNLSRPVVLIHDHGEDNKVRRLHRQARQHSFLADGRTVNTDLLIEDPVPRQSDLSYFIQAADLVAYAAFRRIQPPGQSTGTVCDARMWEELKAIWLTEVSPSRNDGILVRPE